MKLSVGTPLHSQNFLRPNIDLNRLYKYERNGLVTVIWKNVHLGLANKDSVWECGFEQDRQRNIETSSPNHCCNGKAIGITYSECVSVNLGI
jgi:hypothetical protein